MARNTQPMVEWFKRFEYINEFSEIDISRLPLRDIVAQSWETLHELNLPDPRLFTMGGIIVEVAQDSNGNPIILPVKEATLKLLVDHSANFVTFDQINGYKTARPPGDAVKAMLHSSDPWLPHLGGVASTPIFAVDGGLRTDKGYDYDTRFFLQSDVITIPPVSHNPSNEELTTARNLLIENLLGDFPFDTQADLANAIAFLLLPFIRKMILGPTPLHVVSAPVAGTGKTLLAQLLALPSIGQSKTVMTEGRDDDEWRKRLTATLKRVPRVILIYNLSRPLDSAAFSAALTTNVWEDRILGASKIITVPIQAAWIATGNNPSWSQELARRIVPIRLNSQVENPWDRKEFRHSDITVWAEAHRSELVWAALTICMASAAMGWPDGSKSLGSYERYSRLMSGILEVAGIDGFLENRDESHTVVEDDTAIWIRFTTQWWNKHEGRPVRAKQLLALAERLSLLPSITSGRDHHGSITALGRALSSNRDRIFGRYSIHLVRQDGHSKSNMFELREVM